MAYCGMTSVLLLGSSLVVASAQQAQPAAAPAVATAPDAVAPAQSAGQTFVIPAGTKVLLSLRSSISTKTARPGDTVYLNSDFPVIIGGRVVIPAGVFVQGYIDGLQRPGKVKGRAQLMMHFVSMAFPNGVVIALPGAMDRMPGTSTAQVKDKEGLIEQNSNKTQQVKTVGEATLGGASVGALVGAASGNMGEGLGIGAGAGAAAGVVAMFMKHGEDIVIPQGATVEMVMQRPLEVQEQQLSGMPQLTGYEGPPMAPAHAEQTPMPKPQAQPQANQ
jgi:type IV secretion system protein VirB10